MVRILLIGFGGFVGSILRYLVSGYVQSSLRSFEFPYGTLTVNLTGCFIIGFLAQLAEGQGVFSTETRLFLFVGILGGFTTFSAFGNETWNLMRDGQQFLAFMNVAANVILGLAAVWIGHVVVHMIWR